MTDMPSSFSEIVALWGTSHGSRIAMAAEFRNVSATQVSKWFQRNWIPPEYWAELLNTDRARAASLNSELLTRLAAREAVEARA